MKSRPAMDKISSGQDLRRFTLHDNRIDSSYGYDYEALAEKVINISGANINFLMFSTFTDSGQTLAALRQKP